MKNLFLAAAVFMATTAVFTQASAQNSAQTHSVKTVTMKSISYDPKILAIKVGDSVQWENTAHTGHSATADDGKTFDTGMVAVGAKSNKIEFSTAGTYPYHCSVHGKTMSGVIVVTP